MKEQEIRPKELFQNYLRLCERDSQQFNPVNFQNVDCPGCDASNPGFKFKKNGFSYVICRVCHSLYCTPRPSEEALENFYKNSESSRYWATVFFPAVAETRREKLFRRKASDIFTLLHNRKITPKKFCDVGAGYGIFLEELSAVFPRAEFFAIEPNKDFAKICRSKGYPTLEATAENSSMWTNRFDFVICSEVIEHVYSTFLFTHALYDLLKADGYCLVTGLGYEGFDILTLQEYSNSIFPPHHINFLSIQGVEILFKKVGFRDIKVWTPGELDIDIVLNSDFQNEFVETLALRGSSAVKAFQQFLQKHRLSSHMWILGRK